MNFDLETKIFTGKTKPFASVYMSSPEDENFGEGTTTADKDGHFYAEWATTPKQITAYAFDEDGNFSEEVTYQVPAKKQNEAVVTAPEKIKENRKQKTQSKAQPQNLHVLQKLQKMTKPICQAQVTKVQNGFSL